MGNNLSLFRYLADDPLALAIQLIELQEFLHLAIISLGIRVYHLPRRTSVIHVVAEIVEHHVAIKHSDTLIQCFFCKAIVVVPRLHILDDGFHIAICRNASHLLIISEHLDYILGREAQHLVELWLYGDIPSHIIPTCYIIKCNRTDTHHEDTLEVSLELLEDITIESIGMSNGMIHFLTMLIEHYISKIIIFIDDKIKLKMICLGCIKDYLHLISILCLRLDFLNLLITIICSILLYKTIQLDAEIGIESFLQNFYLTCYLRKIQKQYLVNSLQGCRMLPYPQTTEEFFETLLLVTVIVRVEHTEKYALSKTTGTDEEEIARLLLQLWQKHRLMT